MAVKEDFENHCWQGLFGSDILEIYAPYQRETTIRGHTALLLIDLYQLSFAGGAQPVLDLQASFPSSCGEYAWRALPKIQSILDAARTAHLPIFYSTRDLRNTRQPQAVTATQRKGAKKLNPDDYRIQPELAPQAGEVTIYKERASCFFGTPLISYLQQHQIETLIVCGESTSGCVRATVVDGYSYGLHMVVVEEGVFDRNWIAHQANLFDLHHKYADVMHSDEVLSLLAARS